MYMAIVHYHIWLEPQISSGMSLLDWENHLVKVLRTEFEKWSLGYHRDVTKVGWASLFPRLKENLNLAGILQENKDFGETLKV